MRSVACAGRRSVCTGDVAESQIRAGACKKSCVLGVCSKARLDAECKWGEKRKGRGRLLENRATGRLSERFHCEE
jgi:hypothetical protein